MRMTQIRHSSDHAGPFTREGPLNTALLLWSLLFGSVGFGFFLYGMNRRAAVPLVCGMALMVFPYFVSDAVVLVAVGVVLTAIPYFIRA